MSPSGESNAPSFGRRLLDALPALASLAALLVAVTYAITRDSYVQFYDRFGITPDDVGISASGRVAGSAIGVLVFILAYAALPLVLALVIFLAMYDPVTCRLRGPGPRTRLPAIVLSFSLPSSEGRVWPGTRDGPALTSSPDRTVDRTVVGDHPCDGGDRQWP